MNKLHDVVQILKAAGWKNNCDAQWSGIEAALPKLAALLSCNSPAEPVARDVLMDALNEVKQTIHDTIDGVDFSAIADRYAAQPPAVAVPSAVELLREMEWQHRPHNDHWHTPAGFYCPECLESQKVGHAADCKLAAVLAAAQKP